MVIGAPQILPDSKDTLFTIHIVAEAAGAFCMAFNLRSVGEKSHAL